MKNIVMRLFRDPELGAKYINRFSRKLYAVTRVDYRLRQVELKATNFEKQGEDWKVYHVLLFNLLFKKEK